MTEFISIDKKTIEINFTYLLRFFSFFTKLSVFLFLVGFFQQKPFILIEFNFVIKLILGFFLIYRFNSYRKYKIEFTEFDRKACYSAGMFIIIISFIDYINQYMDKVRQVILPYTLPLVDKVKQTIITPVIKKIDLKYLY
jgi:hypothetical protein